MDIEKYFEMMERSSDIKAMYESPQMSFNAQVSGVTSASEVASSDNGMISSINTTLLRIEDLLNKNILQKIVDVLLKISTIVGGIAAAQQLSSSIKNSNIKGGVEEFGNKILGKFGMKNNTNSNPNINQTNYGANQNASIVGSTNNNRGSGLADVVSESIHESAPQGTASNSTNGFASTLNGTASNIDSGVTEMIAMGVGQILGIDPMLTSMVMSVAPGLMEGFSGLFGMISKFLLSPLGSVAMVVMGVASVFYFLIAIINKVCGTTLSATGLIIGAMFAIVAIVYNGIALVINGIIMVAQFLINSIIGFVAFYIGTIGQAIGMVLSMIQALASKVDKIFHTNMAESMQGSIDFANSVGDKINDQKVSFDTLEYANVKDKFNAGNEVGTNLQNSVVSGLQNMFARPESASSGYVESSVPSYGETGGYEGTDFSDTSAYIEESNGYLSIISDSIQRLVEIVEKEGVKNEITVNNSMPVSVKTFNSQDKSELINFLINGALQSVASGTNLRLSAL